MSDHVHKRLPRPRFFDRRRGAARAALKRCAKAGAVALLTLGLSPLAQAAEGALDPAFGVNSTNPLRCSAAGGIMTCDFASGRDQLFGMEILPDGEILVGGNVTQASVPPGADLALARFGPDGLINGLETTDVDGVVNEVADLALQDDDGQKKVVVVGRSGPVGSRKFVVARYAADGTLDSGFGNQGIATAPLPGGGENRASAVAVQPADQKIVVGIRSEGNSSADFVLARFTPDGQLDPEFDGDGFVVTSFPDSQLEQVGAVLVQPDGKIVAGGRAGPPDDNQNAALIDRIDFALVRYNPDGSLDNSFGTNGRVRTDFGSGRTETIVALVLQDDGKIVAGGNSRIGDTRRFALARYDANGALDPSFGVGGTRTTGFPGQPAALNALSLQPGGKLVAVGRAFTEADEPSDFALARYQPNGREDTTFGEDRVDDLGGPAEGVPDGFILTHLGPVNSTSSWQDVAIDPDGNIVAVGFHRLRSSGAGANELADFALARYQASVIPENLTCQGRIPTVIGTPDDDILVGTQGDDVIHGLGGNDLIIAQGGNDIVCGGPGNDGIFTGSGSDSAEGNEGDDLLVGDRRDPPDTQPGNDVLRGDAGNDMLFGEGGNDLLEGGDGDDQLVGGPGNDELEGGPSNDTVNGGPGDDVVLGGRGNDKLVGDLPGERGKDRMSGGPGKDVLFGGAANDKLFGNGGADIMLGEGGKDDRGNGGRGENQCFSLERAKSCGIGQRRPSRPTFNPPDLAGPRACNVPQCGQ